MADPTPPDGSPSWRDHLPSWQRLVATVALLLAATGLLSILRVDQAQLRGVTVAKLLRDHTSALSAQAAGPVRLEVHGDEGLSAQLSKHAGRTLTVQDDAPTVARLSVVEKDGVLHLDASAGTKAPVTGTLRLARWTSLLPPVVAIILALMFRRVIVALFAAVWLGACLHHGVGPIGGLGHTLGGYVWDNLTDPFHYLIFAFTFSLVGMIGIVTRMGGTHALVDVIARRARTARSTRVATALMGLAVFFDDYANTVVVGTTMRALTDRMRISREKLAYLVDSTAAPIAGIAVISTWIGFEVGLFQGVSNYLGLGKSGYTLFFEVLPYRFYCLFTIVFVFASAGLNRDYGPMLRAERRASRTGEVLRKDATAASSSSIQDVEPAEGAPLRWYNAAVPVGTVIFLVFAGMVLLGARSSLFAQRSFSVLSYTDVFDAFVAVGESDYDGPLVMALASAIGSLVAMCMALAQRILTVGDVLRSWLSGARMMILANAVLLMAWSIQSVCDDVGTSFYLTAALHGAVSAAWLPLLVFLLAAVVAFATGTSWGTMGILVPTVGPMAAVAGEPFILVLCLGAVLDGAIFGDHCSPLSDTTVLSSIASSCDHLDHVRTQIPYALTTMLLAGFGGYLFVSLGGPLWGAYALGFGGIFGVLLVVGRNPDVDPA